MIIKQIIFFGVNQFKLTQLKFKLYKAEYEPNNTF